MSEVVGQLDASHLAQLLAVRFGIGLAGEIRQRNNNATTCVRATDLPSPNGFVVQVVTGWRSIEAVFVPDNFAGQLIWSMGQADQAARLAFAKAAAGFASIGARLALRINEAPVADITNLPTEPWQKFDLKVVRMSESTTVGGDAVVKEACEVAATCLALVLALLPLEEDHAESVPLFEAGLPEGARTRVEVNKYERSPVNRAACIAKHGAFCNVCGFNFASVYGNLGDGYIEVHHLVPVSKMDGGYVVDPMVDLIPLCSNCHSIVHRRDPPLSLDALRALLDRERGSKAL